MFTNSIQYSVNGNLVPGARTLEVGEAQFRAIFTSVKFRFANKIDVMHERSLVSVKVDPRSTSSGVLLPFLFGRRGEKDFFSLPRPPPPPKKKTENKIKMSDHRLLFNLVPRSHSVLHWKVRSPFPLAVGDLGTRLVTFYLTSTLFTWLNLRALTCVAKYASVEINRYRMELAPKSAFL